ncbi:pentapeptide repeat-containing protein [Thermococcus thermotolerans]|uniref:pentapeptide repeat-containing protein n=1 Tax=Thermococcus thermotolerans TaxID=2969672 RepID=UPI0021577253|nr:pentapeptide repeat-containing protein [Thermococcus thermotolerans]
MCRMERFGNCDPETKNQEYCIFHKPNKSEEEAREFWEKFFGTFKPKIEEREVDGRKQKVLVFEKPIDAKGFVFPDVPQKPIKVPIGDSKKNFCTRDDCFDFRGAVFKEDVRFDDAVFGHISFYSATFEKEAHFENITMSFEGRKPVFRKTHFKGRAYFNNATLKNVWFQLAVFSGRAEFNGATLINVSFDSAKFKKLAKFEMTTFDGLTRFFNAVFGSSELFKKALNEDIRITVADFTGALFKKTSIFVGSRFWGDVIFDQVIFERTALFAQKNDIATWPMFYGLVSFANCDFRQGISLVTPSGKKDVIKDIEDQIKALFCRDSLTYYYSLREAARVQRLSFEKEGKRDEADQMFVVEMRARRKIRLQQAKARGLRATLWALLINFGEWVLGDFPSNYGTAWRRLLALVMGIIVGNAVPYTIWSHQIYGFPETSNALVRFANALYYSLVTFTTLGYGDMHPTGWLKALSALEALTGAVFMALIVAVIARKWMR